MLNQLDRLDSGLSYEYHQAFQQAPPTSIVLNQAKLGKLDLEKVNWSQNGYYLPQRPNFAADPLWHAGAYYVQEASSMVIGSIIPQLDLPKGATCLDLCAAPGGKSIQLLASLPQDTLLVSNEIIASRAKILKENLVKWGSANTVVSQSNPINFGNRLKGLFDLILVDAPCSGEGLFRKDPKAIQEWSENQVTMCGARQKEIIEDIWPALKEGGYLIYSTCTFNSTENEGVLKWLQDTKRCALAPLKLTEKGIIPGKMKHTYHFIPGRVKGEGLFVSMIQKLESTQQPKIKKARPGKFSSQQLLLLSKPNNFSFLKEEDVVRAIPSNQFDLYLHLAKNLNILHAGVPLKLLKGKKELPHPYLPFSVAFDPEQMAGLTLNYEDAIRYISRSPFSVKSQEPGWQYVSFDNVSLGLIKHLGNRINNYFPKYWRLRHQPRHNFSITDF